MSSTLGPAQRWKSAASPLASRPPPHSSTFADLKEHSQTKMADEKKRNDDYIVELDDRRPNGHTFEAEAKPAPAPSMHASSSMTNNPTVSILCYCGSSIMMTVANKYCVNNKDFNLTFFLLFVQVSNIPNLVYHPIPFQLKPLTFAMFNSRPPSAS